jgi:hypothetical protein
MLNISISDTDYLISQVRTTDLPAWRLVALVPSTIARLSHLDPHDMEFD